VRISCDIVARKLLLALLAWTASALAFSRKSIVLLREVNNVKIKIMNTARIIDTTTISWVRSVEITLIAISLS
jgi:hypothetical protein